MDDILGEEIVLENHDRHLRKYVDGVSLDLIQNTKL